MGNCYSSKEEQVDIKPVKKAKSKKGANIPSDFAQGFQEEDGDLGDALWEDCSKLQNDGVTDEQSFLKEGVDLKRKGKTAQLFKPEVYKELRQYMTPSVRTIHEELGGFAFRRSELDSVKTKQSELETKDTQSVGKECQYIGQWNKKTKKRDGRGIAAYKDGSIYEGFWKDGSRHGAGRMIYASGDVYQGDFANDKAEGYGVFISKDNLRQKGDWKTGKLEGDGYEIDDSENIFRGKFENGMKEGHGEIQLKDGGEYNGDFSSNEIHGFGTYTYQNGSTYEGEFKAGLREGRGKYTFANGDIYDGEYVNNKKEGHGKYFYFEKHGHYDGPFKDDKFHGTGKYCAYGEKPVPVTYNEGVYVKAK